jgi:nucleoid DNA-binding protein
MARPKKKAIQFVSEARAMTQAAVIAELAEENEMSKGDVKFFFESLSGILKRELNLRSRKAPGKMVIPGICRVVAKRKPARKARKGINPFTKEEMMFKARPATTVVKINPVKALKDAIAG